MKVLVVRDRPAAPAALFCLAAAFGLTVVEVVATQDHTKGESRSAFKESRVIRS